MSNPSSASFNSPKHSSGSFESASSDHPPSPPPSPVHPLSLFPFPLPPQVFIPEEVAPFNWSDDEKEDSEELRLKAEEDATTAAFMDSPISPGEDEGFLGQAWSLVLYSILTLRSQTPLTTPLKALLMAPLMILTQGKMKARKRRRKKKMMMMKSR